MTDARPYSLVVVGDAKLGREIGRVVSGAVEERLKFGAVHVSRRLPEISDPAIRAPQILVVVAWRASSGLSSSDSNVIARAIGHAIPVLPIVAPGESPSGLPEPLSRINAADWTAQKQVVLDVVRLLGLAELDRKVFLSYKRADSDGLAEQLRRALQCWASFEMTMLASLGVRMSR